MQSDGTVTIPVSQDQYTDDVYYTSYNEREGQDGGLRIPIKFQDDELDRSKKIRVVREKKRAGATRRRMRTADSRAYIVGARYYHGEILMSGESYGSQMKHNGIVLRGRRHSPRVCLLITNSVPNPLLTVCLLVRKNVHSTYCVLVISGMNIIRVNWKLTLLPRRHQGACG